MISDAQIKALKYLIAVSKNGDVLAKKLYFLLIEKSAGLTKEVCFTLTEAVEGYTGDEINAAAYAADAMGSSNGTTHIQAILAAMGSELKFSHHYGYFGSDGKFDTTGMFPGAPVSIVSDPKLAALDAPIRYTFWLASEYYSRSAERISVTRDEIMTTDLSRPGLYPHMERSEAA